MPDAAPRRVEVEQADVDSGKTDRCDNIGSKHLGAPMDGGNEREARSQSGLLFLLGLPSKEKTRALERLQQETARPKLSDAQVEARRLRIEQMARETAQRKLPIEAEAKQRFAGIAGVDVALLLSKVTAGETSAADVGPMGFADPDYTGSQYPRLEFETANGQCRLKPTSAAEASNHKVTILPIGEHDLGQVVEIDATRVFVKPASGGKFFALQAIAGVEPGWKGCQIKRGVSPETYKEIEIRELEHLVDFSYAFHLGTAALVKAIADVAGRKFGSEQEALTELTRQLTGDALALVPEDPLDKSAWSERAQAVVSALAGMSTIRDSCGSHSPSRIQGKKTGNVVMLESTFETPTPRTTDIILLGKVAHVYGAKPVAGTRPAASVQGGSDAGSRAPGERPDPSKFRQGTTFEFAVDRRGVEFLLAMGGQGYDTGRVRAGCKVEIVSEPIGDVVWVLAKSEDVGLAGCQQSLVYFSANLDWLK